MFICVNTPPLIQEEAELLGQQTDLRAFKSVLKSIGEAASKTLTPSHKLIINKSTVPIGTSKMTIDLLQRHVEGPVENTFTVVSMPEFLAEGQAI